MSSAQSHPSGDVKNAATDAAPAGAFVAPPPHLTLYFGHWAPRGVKPEWEKCSMEKASSLRLLGSWGEKCGELIECVAWFDDPGAVRVLVADFDSGRRLLMRSSARGWKITFERHDRPLATQEPA